MYFADNNLAVDKPKRETMNKLSTAVGYTDFKNSALGKKMYRVQHTLQASKVSSGSP